MAGGRHQKQNHKSKGAQNLKGEADKGIVVQVANKETNQGVKVAVVVVPTEGEPGVIQGEEEHCHSHVSPIVEKRQKSTVQAREGTNGKDDMEQNKSC